MIIFVSKNGWLLNHEPFLSHSLLSELIWGVFIVYLFYDSLYIIFRMSSLSKSLISWKWSHHRVWKMTQSQQYFTHQMQMSINFCTFICDFSSWSSDCLTISVQMAIELKTNRCNFIKK